MTIRARFIFFALLMAVVLVLPAIFAASQLKQVRDIAVEQRVQHASAFLALGRLQAHLAEVDRFERSYVAAPGEEARRAVRQALANTVAQLNALEHSGYTDIARTMREHLNALTQTSELLEQMVESGRVQEATAYFEKVKPLFARAQNALDEIAKAIDSRSARDLNEAKRISDAAVSSVIISIAVALMIAFVIGALTSRALSTPISMLRRSMAKVAGGEFVVPDNLPYDRADEIGDLARSFRSMTQRLSELDRLRAEFIGIATHELKTPLNVIGGYTELIEEGVYGPVTDKHLEVLGSIRDQIHRLTVMVNQLLDISRLEAGGFRIEMEPVNLQILLEQVRRTFEALAVQKHIEFEITIDSAMPSVILADGDRLRDQVIGNLLSNAFKFTPREGRITVIAKRVDGEVHIAVTDTGVGIPRDQLAHIFDKWHQVGQEARATGTGLGLNIAREVVEAHGGKITVESTAGKGTTFCIIIPAMTPDTTSDENKSAVPVGEAA